MRMCMCPYMHMFVQVCIDVHVLCIYMYFDVLHACLCLQAFTVHCSVCVCVYMCVQVCVCVCTVHVSCGIKGCMCIQYVQLWL